MIITFDIETGPLPDDQLQKIIAPFDRSEVPNPGEFDPESVKYGNTTDATKRAAKLEDCRQKHAALVESYSKDVAAAEKKYWADAIGKAALDGATGKTIIVGFGREGAHPQFIDGEGDEKSILQKFWKRYQTCKEKKIRMVGAGIIDFDLPFLYVRSLVHREPIPETAFDGRYWDNKVFVDVFDFWRCGRQRGTCKYNLDRICRALGVDGKNGNGADFAKLWATDGHKALEYAANDLRMIADVAAVMRII